MSVLDLIKARVSVRKYKEDQVPENVFLQVMQAARHAPSGKNLQPWKFIIVKDKEKRIKLAEASRRQSFMAKAPITIVACGYPDNCYQYQGHYMKSWPIGVTCAIDYLMLMAQDLGLGTCWIGAFEEKTVKSILNVPENVRVLALTPLGYPDAEARPRGRKPLDEIISYENY